MAGGGGGGGILTKSHSLQRLGAAPSAEADPNVAGTVTASEPDSTPVAQDDSNQVSHVPHSAAERIRHKQDSQSQTLVLVLGLESWNLIRIPTFNTVSKTSSSDFI